MCVSHVSYAHTCLIYSFSPLHLNLDAFHRFAFQISSLVFCCGQSVFKLIHQRLIFFSILYFSGLKCQFDFKIFEIHFNSLFPWRLFPWCLFLHFQYIIYSYFNVLVCWLQYPNHAWICLSTFSVDNWLHFLDSEYLFLFILHDTMYKRTVETPYNVIFHQISFSLFLLKQIGWWADDSNSTRAWARFSWSLSKTQSSSGLPLYLRHGPLRFWLRFWHVSLSSAIKKRDPTLFFRESPTHLSHDTSRCGQSLLYSWLEYKLCENKDHVLSTAHNTLTEYGRHPEDNSFTALN